MHCLDKAIQDKSRNWRFAFFRIITVVNYLHDVNRCSHHHQQPPWSPTSNPRTTQRPMAHAHRAKRMSQLDPLDCKRFMQGWCTNRVHQYNGVNNRVCQSRVGVVATRTMGDYLFPLATIYHTAGPWQNWKYQQKKWMIPHGRVLSIPATCLTSMTYRDCLRYLGILTMDWYHIWQWRVWEESIMSAVTSESRSRCMWEYCVPCS